MTPRMFPRWVIRYRNLRRTRVRPNLGRDRASPTVSVRARASRCRRNSRGCSDRMLLFLGRDGAQVRNLP